MIVSDTLLTLSCRRWNVPVLAHLESAGGAPFTFTALREALLVCRDSLTRTLETLARPGWIARRRAGYELTTPGRLVAEPSVDLLETARRQDVVDLVLKKWSFPVLTALHGWELSFAELRASLGGVNPRSLTLALKGMVAAGLVEREVLGGFPPTTSYRLTRAGEAYAPPLARVAGRK